MSLQLLLAILLINNCVSSGRTRGRPNNKVKYSEYDRQ